MRSVTLVSALLGAWLLCATAHAAIKATVDGNQFSVGETIELTLSHDGQTSSQPDLAPLEQDFDVLSTSRSSNVQIINGSMSSQTQLRLTLSPKRSGQLTIPSLTWNDERSSPIQITVSGNGSSSSGTDQAQSSNVYLETSVDEPQPYVQGAVKLTVRLYAGIPIYRAMLDLPVGSDVLVQQLGQDRNREQLVNGREYTVIERQYLLFPQHSGVLEIPGPVLDAQTPVRSRRASRDPFSDFFDPSPFGNRMRSLQPIRIRGDDITLEVKPRPAAATASHWIPAQQLTVTSAWHPESLQTRAGEPVALDVRLRAEGLTAAQLPDVVSLLQLPPGLKAYPDQAQLENTEANGTIVGERVQSVALIADRAGDFDLPPVTIQWWDTKADELRTIELPARTLKVLPGAAGTTSAAAPNVRQQGAPNVELENSASKQTKGSSAENASRGPWQWLSLALVILWLGTVLAWWLSRRRETKTPAGPQAPAPVKPNASRARERFLSACKVNDAMTARRALLEWAQAQWPDAPPVGLRALAHEVEDANTTALLIELDRACFAGGEWNGAALAQALSQLPSAPKRPSVPRSELAELYP